MTAIFHTPGEPAGIGPELLVRLACEHPADDRVAICDPRLLQASAERLGLHLDLIPYTPGPHTGPALRVIERPLRRLVDPGSPSADNAAYLLDTLRVATAQARAVAGAVVTGPIHKATINEAGIAFSGHTEFLAELTDTALPVMMLVAGDLRVALVTTHMPLRAVPDAITMQRVQDCLQILASDLERRFGIARPRIQVCGLNPHAGEAGHLGHEDRDSIAPAIAAARSRGIAALGPVPADTAFTPAALADCDAVLAMYHDQGLPVLKHAGFGHAVNITLGLPFVRTSVDHGTAFDLAGTGRADLGSLREADAMARRLLHG